VLVFQVLGLRDPHLQHRLLVLVTTVACGCASEPEDSLSDPLTIAKLRAAALQVSTIAGLPLPSTMLTVASGDHQVAEDIVSGGAIVNDHVPVFAVVMTGGAFDPQEESSGLAHMAIASSPS
jgi:hypothetical protein